MAHFTASCVSFARMRVSSPPLRGAAVTCHPREELEEINADRRQQLLQPRRAEHTRHGTTDCVHVWSLITAAGPEQLRALLHLRRRPEGSLPEYCADHPGEWELFFIIIIFFNQKFSKVFQVPNFCLDEFYLKTFAPSDVIALLTCLLAPVSAGFCGD